MAAPARRVVAASLRRAAAQAAPRAPLSWLPAATPRCHQQRPVLAASRNPAAAATSARWYSTDSPTPGSRTWRYSEVKELVDRPDGKTILVDVREPQELLETGKIPGAVNIPVTSAVQSFHADDADFEALYGFERPPRDASLVFYCKAGVRARAAAALAADAGWASVGDYPGSWLEWEQKGGRVEKVIKGGNL